MKCAGNARAPLFGNDVKTAELAGAVLDADGCEPDNPTLALGDPDGGTGWGVRDAFSVERDPVLEGGELAESRPDESLHSRVPGGFVGAHEVL